MVLRKLSLSEWFLRYQLLKFQKHHFFLPMDLDVDITPMAEQYEKIPTTALLVKAAALLQKKAPYSHRIIFPTLFGPRLVQATEPIVNLPIAIQHNGEEVLTAIAIKGADKKSLEEIKTEIKQALAKPLKDYKIVHFVHTRKNSLFNRLLLRGLYYLAYCVPSLYIQKGGGSISVSSLVNQCRDNFRIRPVAYGPTAFTICFVDTEKTANGKSILKLGIGYDHTAFTGNECLGALRMLSEILQEELPKALPLPMRTPTRSSDTFL